LFLKRGHRPEGTIAQHRERTALFERWAPMPPADAAVLRGDLGGIAALRIATPDSRPDRHILFLHGGGYVTGSPQLYRHVTWRLASASGARVAAIDYRLPPHAPRSAPAP